MTRIDQYLPRLAPGDATSEHSLHVQAFLHEAGIESDIYAESRDPAMEGRCRHYGDDLRRGDAPILYQLAIGSVLADVLASTPGLRLGINYHNFTPAEFFQTWEPDRIHGLRSSGTAR